VRKIIILSLIISLVAGITAFKNIDLDSEKVTGNYLEIYLRSQDIDFDVKPRAHISDAHIYTASGFLYAMGNPPTSYNFQHPPLIKYLFGYSEILLGSALYIQLLFAITLPLITFFIGLKTFKSLISPFIGALLLIFDPLYQDLSKHTLLDLGQAVFALLYVFSTLYLTKRPYISGIFLGFFAASKFWSPAIVFFFAVEMFLLLKTKKMKIKRIILTLLTAFITFNLVYIVSYSKVDSFNIFFWQAKIAKFMVHHDTASQLGSTLVLFLTGGFQTWWDQTISRDIWSIMWPVSFFMSIYLFIKNKKINEKTFLFAFPVVYLLSLSSQAPFSRYFILPLPFLYLALSHFLANIANPTKS
jgi:predicted membrane-bound dolichyl-phosphate-mannose-protein mannosyltransferase